MPLIRKLMDLKTSRAITLPASWLKNAENEEGAKIIAIALEIDKIITIAPVFEKKEVLAE